ncbi:unnamed protein product [Pseudo-nitzschia multistriata]|uniref:Nucleotide-diphospho-sugar transferase domain-containing protein n=1 Tax=Pseudo-nitzschia multistriata TaxID=183589 RepID=A0A448Z9R4_9STRA|nr:unnamed protein product [Pseudo-nitzschia multistriata]
MRLLRNTAFASRHPNCVASIRFLLFLNLVFLALNTNRTLVSIIDVTSFVEINDEPQYRRRTTETTGSTIEDESQQQQQILPGCPSVIRKKAGLFDQNTSESLLRGDFADTVLLVSSNYAYYNMLQNWEYMASQLHLQWAVLALDNELYEELGPSRAIPAKEEFTVSGPQEFRKGSFQGLTCNKVRMALEVASACKMNVVFTDVDNVFFQNPFEHDLGRLIRSQRYDYVYQPNQPAWAPLEDQCLKGNPRKEANTGFYYFNHKSEIYRNIAESMLEVCVRPENKIDDQSLFWKEFWKAEKRITSRNQTEGSDASFHHCDLSEYVNPWSQQNNFSKTSGSNKRIFQYCCLDPYFYPIGKHNARDGPSNKNPVTYHANYASKYGRKVEKLVHARSDGYGWDMSRFKDGHGGVLEAPKKGQDKKK